MRRLAKVVVAVAMFGVLGVSLTDAIGQPSPGKAPRFAALQESELTAAHREILGADPAATRTLYLFRVCVKTPDLCRAWVPASKYFATSPLSLRDRELLILRTCWLCRNEYTWGNHVPAARRAGLSDADLVRITEGPKAKGWSAADAMVLEAADVLHEQQVIPDDMWKTLSGRYTERELSDLIFIVGQYTFAAMWARSGGFPMEPGAPGFPR